MRSKLLIVTFLHLTFILSAQRNLQFLQLEKVGSMKVEKIFPDTVTFVFDQKSQKIVPVKLNLTYSFAKQYLAHLLLRSFAKMLLQFRCINIG